MKTKQPKVKMQKYTLLDFEKQFPNDDVCLEWLKNYLYLDGIFCITCQKITNHYRVASRKSFSCQFCGNHVHPTADTIYHKSTTPLRLWFYAVYLMASTRCGISAKQLERELGVTYKTAWRMFKQIRSMLAEDSTQLSGKVKVDETYVGGKMKGSKRGCGSENKTIVAGALERQGNVITRVVPNVQSKTLVPFIQEKVLPSTMIFPMNCPLTILSNIKVTDINEFITPQRFMLLVMLIPIPLKAFGLWSKTAFAALITKFPRNICKAISMNTLSDITDETILLRCFFRF